MPDEIPDQDDFRGKIDAALDKIRQLSEQYARRPEQIEEPEKRHKPIDLDQRPLWYAPTESQRWQHLTPEERRTEWREAAEAARRTGSEVMSVGGMLFPYPLFTPVEPPSGMWPPDGMTTRIGADGGTWLVPAAPDDDDVMRPIVEAAMREDKETDSGSTTEKRGVGDTDG